MRRKVLVLTGPVHSGKTTFLKGAAACWDRAGFSVGGFLSEAHLVGGTVRGYDLFDLRERTSVPFMRREERPGRQRVGSFSLVPGGLERAESILNRDRNGPILIVDEIGPLELGGRGLWPALSATLSGEATCLCVVRTSVLERFLAKIGEGRTVVFRHGDTEVLEGLTRWVRRRGKLMAGPGGGE